jgi:hypothetical protein
MRRISANKSRIATVGAGREGMRIRVSGLWASYRPISALLAVAVIVTACDSTQPPLSMATPNAFDVTPSPGDLRGTWDYAFDEAGRDVVLADFAGLVDAADEVVTRIGFDGSDWWQGFLFDGKLFLLEGFPEGDGGSYVLVEDMIVMTGAHGEALLVYEWTIEEDSLSLTVVEECAVSGTETTCTRDRSEMDRLMLLVTDQTFTRSGSDPSY